jgi:threonyl-tRNA synthetase
MRVLFIHADHFEYEVRDKAVKIPEEISDAQRKAAMDEALVAFCTIEKEDEKNPELIITRATENVRNVADQVHAKNIILYPYAHLSSSLGSRDPAIQILKGMEKNLANQGYNVKRSPFGWYKSFVIRCKGHPLSELSRSITIEEEKTKATTIEIVYKIMDVDGKLYTPDEYMKNPGRDDFKSLVEKEALKQGLLGGQPKFLDYCKKFGIEWEPFSDVGHMRYGPEATLMFDLVAEYSWMVAKSLAVPIFQVRGTNMFNLAERPVREHAKLFGSKLYEVKVDEKEFVLRYAACHQQFSMVKDWSLSYKQIPFGTFEVADSYRLEQSGELLLCFRVRKMHMPDLHIYCKNLDDSMKTSFKVHEKIYEEIRKLNREYVSIYNTTRNFYDKNIEFFRKLIEVERKPILLGFVPDNIYYWVLNIEYNIIDELDRPREIGTIQIDVGNAERFGISYVDENGSRKYPPIIHTALIGTVERYIYTLLDQAALDEKKGKKPSIPVWISPTQVRVIPVAKEHLDYASRVADDLEKVNIRVDVDDRDESVPKKVRSAEIAWISYVVVVGEKEIENNVVSVRTRFDKSQKTIQVEELRNEVLKQMKGYPVHASTLPRMLSARPGYKTV